MSNRRQLIRANQKPRKEWFVTHLQIQIDLLETSIAISLLWLLSISQTNKLISESTNEETWMDLKGSSDQPEGNEQSVQLFQENPTNEHQKHKHWLLPTPSSNFQLLASFAGYRASVFA